MDKVIEYGLQRDMIFLVLFVLACGGLAWLVKYVLKTSGERENRLIAVTETLAEKLGIVEDIKNGLVRVENRVNSFIDKERG